LPKDHMEILLDVVEKTLQNKDDFERAKQLSEIVLDNCMHLKYDAIPMSLYLSSIAVIDFLEKKSSSNGTYNYH